MSADTVVLKVRRTNGGTEDVLIDVADLPLLKPGWLKIRRDNAIHVQRYVGKQEGTRSVTRSLNAARLILGLPHGSRELLASHTNRNVFDLRRCNLRALTPAQKAQNRGPSHCKLAPDGIIPARNVNWCRKLKVWKTACFLNGVTTNLGTFTDHEKAVAVTAAWRAEHMPYATPLDNSAPVVRSGPQLPSPSRRNKRK